MNEDEIQACEGLNKGDFLVHEEIGSLALEDFVFFLLDHDDHITCLSFGDLVALSMLGVSLPIGCTLVDLNLNSLVLLLYLLALAVLANLCGVNALPLAAAIITRPGPLRVHAGSELHHHDAHALALASLAGLHCVGIGAADTLALSANAMSLDGDFGLFAVVEVLKRNLKLKSGGLDLLGALLSLGSTSASHAEEVKDVVEAGWWTTIAKALLTMLVVELALLRV